MAKVVLLLEYEGTAYHGFQFQTNAPTVQEELERALLRLTGEETRVVAASRTDAGVHARGQVVSFRTKASFPPPVWVRALNFYLPQDIAVKAAYLVEEDFDVRRWALSREYCYSLLNAPTRSPLKLRFACFVPHPLDVEAMNQACQLLLGEQDFASFTPVATEKMTVRRVCRAEVGREGDLLLFRMKANSFLPYQVRNTVGVLVRVGRGKMAVGEFRRMAQARTPGLAGPAFPPYGLCLEKISYPRPLEGRA